MASIRDDVRTFIERQAEAGGALGWIQDNRGTKTTALVTNTELVYQMPASEFDPSFTHPPQEWSIQGEVRLENGEVFSASFPLFLDEIGDPPALRETIVVWYHPADRSRVRPDISWRQRSPADGTSLRWKVPAVCPNCGARVDQSTESVAAHPACRQCQAPLPSEPVG